MKKLILIIMPLFLFLSIQIKAVASNEQDLNIVSKAAILIDSKSGAVLFEKNAQKKMYPASLTKIATAIYAIEKGNLDEMVTVSEESVQVDGTRVYLNPGEQVPLRKLVQGMLINSGNDAAHAIADHLHGDIETFSDHLNQFLKAEVGVNHTHFTNPHGLFDKKHYTTAYDLALITNYALKSPDFKEIFGTKELPWQGKSWDTTIYTHHRLLKGEIPFEGITGGKTGFVNESRQTLATTAHNEQIELTAVVLKADFKNDIYKDTMTLLDYGYTHYRTSSLEKDTEYRHGDEKFVLEKDTIVTVPIEGPILNVSAAGELFIQNDHEVIIQTIPLTPLVKEEAVVAKAEPLKEDGAKGSIARDNSRVYMLITAALLSVGLVWFILKRRVYR
ncbi:D-alanyl-D-alanine carboxypeptidase family protein [Bacillus sp. 31A1R]|uniref:D-alanyl-D-alanine carboxypeptidase family protein n=1 Tax=Robertmurraya mangrovi TaxID=3098077 RepID=A0ABU5J5A6_9BACI|nr:D-alanyl-D-alanine carboxypeptidase family protein [Bacillus sp. 31A1R]MDZ5474511.1 D-alanyl-D-alanine carboxypeptidase family protein [Bacillus sp. 31A1R]